MTNSKCIPMYILVHNLNRVLFNTNVHTYTASPVLYYYRNFLFIAGFQVRLRHHTITSLFKSPFNDEYLSYDRIR